MNINGVNLSPNIGAPQGLGTPQEIANSGASATVSETVLPASANVLTSSDLSMISAATGAQFTQTSQGLQMVQLYRSGVPVNSSDYAASVAEVEQELKNNHQGNVPPAGVDGLALGGAEFQYAENFTNSIISIRDSVGPNQSITPAMIIAGAKQSNANNATIPEDYVANAIGYLNGIALE